MPRPMRVPEKSKDFKGSIKKIIKSLENFKYLVLISLALAFASAILALITPNKLSDLTDTIALGIKPNITKEMIADIMNDDSISVSDKLELNNLMNTTNTDSLLSKIDELPKPIYDKIKPRINTEKAKNIIILLAVLHILSALFTYAEGIIMTVVSGKYAKKMRTSISNKINKLPLKYFDGHEIGDTLSRVTNDVDTVSHNLNDSLTSIVSNVTLLIGSAFMMLITNWIMGLTAIISCVIGFILMGVILKKSQKYFIMRQKELGNLNGYIEEIYSGHNVVKAYNGEEKANNQFDKLNKNLYEYNRKSQFLSGIMQPMMMFIGNLGYVLVCIVGSILTMNNMISFGVIVAFMIYVRMFTSPLSRIAQSMTSFQSIAAAAERVFEFLEENEMSNESKLTNKIDNTRGKIEFKHVKFGYDEDKTIIKDFNALVKPGEKIAIVGPTGAGKTTMVNLLMKFYEIDAGDILIDDVSIKDLKREKIHNLFTMVLQDTWLFDGTIKENLKFNNKNVTDKEINDICKTVGIDHFINTLPEGIDTEVGSNESISQGEKQLLTIARGMIDDKPFLILDEATSNVDTRTEELVQKAMDKLVKGKTSFIIAHRLSTIKNADLILVMNEGNIVEQGTHEELLNKKGFYADLYNSQFDTLI